MKHNHNISSTGDATSKLGIEAKPSHHQAGNMYWDACKRIAQLEQENDVLKTKLRAAAEGFHMVCWVEVDEETRLLTAEELEDERYRQSHHEKGTWYRLPWWAKGILYKLWRRWTLRKISGRTLIEP